MADDFAFTLALAAIAKGEIDLETDDLRMLIVMASTTVADEEDAEFLSDFSDLDEYDGAAYARVPLDAQAVTAETADNRAKFTSDPAVFPTLGVGSRIGQAVIIYKHVGADSANIPIFYKEPTAFPFQGNGENVTITPHADGWAYLGNV